MINDGTYAIGCGAALCGKRYYAFCNYASGQSTGQFPYSLGPSCSKCSTTCTNNLCSCNKVCANYGTLDINTCTCKCQPYTTGDTCETLVCSQTDKQLKCWG